MGGTSFAHDFGSGFTEGETDFNCEIHFNIKECPPPTYAYHLGLSDLDNKIKHRNHAKYLIQKISKVFMRSFRDEILNKRNTFSYTMLSRLTSPDRDLDQESTSIRDTFTCTMNVCGVELLIRSTKKNLMDKFFSEEFNKNRKKYYN